MSECRIDLIENCLYALLIINEHIIRFKRENEGKSEKKKSANKLISKSKT